MPQRAARARPLRIVHVSPTYAPLVGGAERLLQAVSERLVARGHHVTVLTFDYATMQEIATARRAGLPSRETINGVDVRRFDPDSARVNRFYEWLVLQRGGYWLTQQLVGDDEWALCTPNGLRTLLPTALLRADVVTSINWHFASSYWACLPRRLRRAARVAFPILHIEQEWAKNPLYPRMLNNCDAVIVCTDAEREFVEARGGRRLVVAGGGVDPASFERRDGARIRAAHGIGEHPVVGFVGRQDTLKGVPTLIDAMAIVWRRVPDAVLLLAGPSTHREPAVAQKLDALAACDRAKVVLIDDFSDDDGPSIMDACDILALPSVEESFGMVMIEAWMCGKPVIGADIASTRCIVDPGVDGLLVRPFDSGDLAAKLLELLGDPAKRARFGERGRAKVLERYTWDHVTDIWEATFKSVAPGEPFIST